VVVAEVAQAHEGSVGMAHAFIDAIANAGADVVKFQTHIAAAESTPMEPWRVEIGSGDASRYDYWKRMEFTAAQWHALARHARERGLLFLSSPFSLEAIDLLREVGVCAWKVPSGEMTSTLLIDRMLAMGLPMILSTGMSSLDEIDQRVALAMGRGVPVAVVQCTTAYPCPPDQVGVNLIPVFRQRYGCFVGLSDHSGTIYPGLAAATLGADILEVHVTLSREMFGPDVAASVTTGELRQLIAGIDFIEQMVRHPIDKDAAAHAAASMRRLFGKSIVARTDLPRGTILREEHLALKKPGHGIAADRLQDVLNTRLRRPLSADELLDERDLEPIL
jgi:N-acetylneuraminate synthase